MKRKIAFSVIAIAVVIVTVGIICDKVFADTVSVGWKFLPFTSTSSNVTTAWFNIDTGYMYDNSNNVLDDNPTWSNCYKAITIDQYSGLFKETPETTMPSGKYIWRQWDSATPLYTDAPDKSKYVEWNQTTKRIVVVSDI